MPLAEFIAVVASEETGTCSSAVHARRVAGVDRGTIGRSSAQVFVDGPGGGAPSDEQGRSCYDYDADQESAPLSSCCTLTNMVLSAWLIMSPFSVRMFHFRC